MVLNRRLPQERLGLQPRLELRIKECPGPLEPRTRLGREDVISSLDPLRRPQVPHRTWVRAPLQDIKPDQKLESTDRQVDLDKATLQPIASWGRWNESSTGS